MRLSSEQQLIKLFSKGYVVPGRIFKEEVIQKAKDARFLVDDRPVKIIKQIKNQYEDVISAKVDSRYNFENDTILFD